jgi:hypothetical protein
MRMTAAQHISGVLTQDQSLKGRGGFQTILHTPDMLSQDDVRTIEHRVQCVPAGEKRAKWQYCRLSGERPMITRIIPIPEPDEFGRRGRYLTHSLIFDPSDWRRIDDAPFDLMRPGNFFSSIEQVLEFYGFKAGKAPAALIEVRREWNKEAEDLIRKWPVEQLKGLIELTGTPQRMIEQGHYIQLLGSETQILGALKVVFHLGSPSAREIYSFDTNASGCDWRPDASFWARGFTSGNKAGARFVIDAAGLQVSHPEPSSGNSPCGKWIESMARAERFSMLQENLERARALALFLEGREPKLSLGQEMDDDFQKSFAEANAGTIRERVEALLLDQISQPLRQAAVEQVSRTPATFLRYLIEGQQEKLNCDLLFQTILRQVDFSPAPADLELLTSLGEKHIGLKLLLALIPGNELRRIKILANMSSDHYRLCIEELQKRPDFQAWQIFSTQHLDAWFGLYNKCSVTEDLRKAISYIAKHGRRKDRRPLEGIVRYLRPDQQKDLRQWLDSSSYRLRKLKAALAKALKATEVSPSSGKIGLIVRRLKTIFARRA